MGTACRCAHSYLNLKTYNMKISTYFIAGLLALTSMAASAGEVEDFSYDWTQQTSHNFWKPTDVEDINLTVNNEGLQAVNNTKRNGNWIYQFHVADGITLKQGEDYVLKITVKGSDAGYCFFGVGTWGNTVDCGFNFSNEWKEYSVPFTAPTETNFVVAQMGSFVGTVQFKSVKVCHYEGTFTGGYMNFDLGPATENANKWDKKLIYSLAKPLESDANYILTMDVKASQNLDEGIGLWPIFNASENKTS